jgi:large subunit ribosomal protein L29
MAIKKKELSGMGETELKAKLDELRRSLIKDNAQIASGTVPKSPGQVKTTKKLIARILTLMKTKKEKTKIKEEE